MLQVWSRLCIETLRVERIGVEPRLGTVGTTCSQFNGHATIHGISASTAERAGWPKAGGWVGCAKLQRQWPHDGPYNRGLQVRVGPAHNHGSGNTVPQLIQRVSHVFLCIYDQPMCFHGTVQQDVAEGRHSCNHTVADTDSTAATTRRSPLPEPNTSWAGGRFLADSCLHWRCRGLCLPFLGFDSTRASLDLDVHHASCGRGASSRRATKSW